MPVQKNPGLKSRPYDATSTETAKTTPQTLATAFRTSMSGLVSRNVCDKTPAIAAISHLRKVSALVDFLIDDLRFGLASSGLKNGFEAVPQTE
jgi:hypothetical protein